MDFWNSLSGMLEAEIVSAKLEWLLLELNRAGIALLEVHQTDAVTSRFWLRRKDWKQAKEICENLEGKITLCNRKGIYWKLLQLRNRKFLICGLLFLVITAMYLPSRILFVKIDGNTAVPEKQILAAAESCGIHFGASRKHVRSEKVKNALLSSVPQLQWAGVNTYGCVANISVKERAVQAEQTKGPQVSSIAASRDGFLLSATATRGNLLVRPGQTVRAGDILISAYTDCGLSIRAEKAEGEILALTNRRLTVKVPLNWMYREKNERQWKKISMVIGKKRIFLWKDSGIPVGSCGRMYKEYYITLPGGFQLPVSICIERFDGYNTEVFSMADWDFKEQVIRYARQHLLETMTAGQILQEHTETAFFTDTCDFTGIYVCQEMIGKVVQEQIGETNGENS